MSKELANSIVLAACQMERSEVPQLISVIRYSPKKGYYIEDPEYKRFTSFSQAYNNLTKGGYQEVSSDRASHLLKLMKIGRAENDVSAPAVVIMSKKVNKE
ncbi:MAG: hypothetical protein ACI8RD_012042 [Bacillariaceae sp.]|jgi:hypothetical protein